MRSSFADDGLTSRFAAGSGVEALLTVKLREAETVLRRAESQVTDAAISMVVERGEELAAELEIAEAQARDLRASLRGLANLWVQDGNGRPGPLRLGRRSVWMLTDGDVTVPEAITGMRALNAARLGHILPPEQPPPDWNAVLAALLADSEAEIGPTPDSVILGKHQTRMMED